MVRVRGCCLLYQTWACEQVASNVFLDPNGISKWMARKVIYWICWCFMYFSILLPVAMDGCANFFQTKA